MRVLNHTYKMLRNVGIPKFVRKRSVRAAVASDVDFRDARPFEEIPGPRGIYNIPVLGAMFHFKPFSDITPETLNKLLINLVDQYGSLVRVRLGEWAVLVEDPADMEVIMKNEGKYPNRKLIPLHLEFCKKTGFIRGIGHLQGEEWHKFRSPINPRMLRAKSAQHYLPFQNEVADDLVVRLMKPFTPEELQAILYRYTCESISVVAYNKRLGYLDPDIEHQPEKLQALRDIRTFFDIFTASQNIPEFAVKYFPLKIKRDYDEVVGRIIGFAKQLYVEAMDDIRKQEQEGTLQVEENNFLLSLLMTEKLTPEQMAAIAVDLFVAGTDSTAGSLQTVLYNLARYPDKQQTLYDEVHSVLGASGPLTVENQNKLNYLFACVRESFRLIYPALLGAQRYLPTDIILQGYRIPAGTSVMLMNQKTLKDERFFRDPESYIPERWLRSEEGKRADPIPPTAYLPFGFGPRQCLGRRFAEQEIYLAVVKILQNFEVSLEPGQENIEVIYKPFSLPKEPIRFIFKKRS